MEARAPHLKVVYLTMILLVAGYWLSMLFLFQNFQILLRLSTDLIWLRLSIWLLPIMLIIGWQGIIQSRRKKAKPLASLLYYVRENRHYLIRCSVFMLLTSLMIGAFRLFKVNYPNIVPYYADSYLADIDKIIFQGQDAWIVTHRIFGQTSTYVIDFFYTMWFTVDLLVMVWSVFARDKIFQAKFVLSSLLAWMVLATLCAFLLSSVGPCFYHIFFDDGRFLPLMGRLPDDLNAIRIQNFLIEVHGETYFGSGISAMPSMHVAISTLLLLAVHDRFGRKWPTWFAAAFLIITVIGSVHLAWHYFVDGIVALIGMIAIWKFSEAFVLACAGRATAHNVQRGQD